MHVVFAAEPEPPEIEEVPAEPLVGISEEDIETIVTRAVEDAVERVTRDTVIEAAEEVSISAWLILMVPITR